MISSEIQFSGNNAEIFVDCFADVSSINKITVKCELQQFDSSWKTIKTWNESKNNSEISFIKTYPVKKNYSYRLKLTVDAYKDSNLMEQVVDIFPSEYFQ